MRSKSKRVKGKKRMAMSLFKDNKVLIWLKGILPFYLFTLLPLTTRGQVVLDIIRESPG